MIQHGFKCLWCFYDCWVDYKGLINSKGTKPEDSVKRTDVCRCGRLGLILDSCGIIRVYSDDLSKTLYCTIDTETKLCTVKSTNKGFVYQDINTLMNTSWSFVEKLTPVPFAKESKVKKAFRKAKKRKENKKD